jgi:hypothetical protein
VLPKNILFIAVGSRGTAKDNRLTKINAAIINKTSNRIIKKKLAGLSFIEERTFLNRNFCLRIFENPKLAAVLFALFSVLLLFAMHII